VPVVGDEAKVTLPVGGSVAVGSVIVAVHVVDAPSDTDEGEQLNPVVVWSTAVYAVVLLPTKMALSGA
jgi:hypothetical protein